MDIIQNYLIIDLNNFMNQVLAQKNLKFLNLSYLRYLDHIKLNNEGLESIN